MRLMTLLLALIAGALSAAPVFAQSVAYPTRAIRLLVPFVPGGSTDFIARVMQPGLSEALGQPIVIDNRPGAAGNIALDMAANANPDGHTVVFGNVGAIAINPAMFRKMPVQPMRDLACVNILADVASMMVVHPSIPVRSLKEFIDYAKARPGKINWGSSSQGSPATLGMQYLADKVGLDMVLVAYKGAGAVATALVSGEVAVAFVAVPPTVGFVRNGQLRALVVRSAKRLELLPEVPSMAEVGFPDLTSDSWQGFFVGARTPAPVVAQLNAAARKVLADPKVLERFKIGAATVIDTETAAKCTAFVKEQTAFWSKVVKQVGLEGSL
jgi:tripartite-type tricarboxylate transporter receptor subunit TctC